MLFAADFSVLVMFSLAFLFVCRVVLLVCDVFSLVVVLASGAVLSVFFVVFLPASGVVLLICCVVCCCS